LVSRALAEDDIVASEFHYMFCDAANLKAQKWGAVISVVAATCVSAFYFIPLNSFRNGKTASDIIGYWWRNFAIYAIAFPPVFGGVLITQAIFDPQKVSSTKKWLAVVVRPCHLAFWAMSA
jgi:hypothetical protein